MIDEEKKLYNPKKILATTCLCKNITYSYQAISKLLKYINLNMRSDFNAKIVTIYSCDDLYASIVLKYAFRIPRPFLFKKCSPSISSGRKNHYYKCKNAFAVTHIR